jgi:hypothetical protein
MRSAYYLLTKTQCGGVMRKQGHQSSERPRTCSPWLRRREFHRRNGSAIPAISSFGGDKAGDRVSRICEPVEQTSHRERAL